MTLTELADRVEAAEGPDRALSCAIGKAIGFRPNFETSSPWAWCPDYTASLDAAMTLVPEGCHVEIERWSDGRGRCEVRWTAHTVGLWSATPALALCAAALRAKAKEQQP